MIKFSSRAEASPFIVSKVTIMNKLNLAFMVLSFWTSCTYCEDGGINSFIQQPEDVWVVRNDPIKITCKAKDVIKVIFYCDGQPVPFGQVVDTENVDGIKTAYIQFTREEVVDTNGDMKTKECYCTVWQNVDIPQTSRIAHIRVASLGKKFLSYPVSKRVAVGSPVELQCRPPEGEPVPDVYWLKDGVSLKQPSNDDMGSRYVVGEQYPTLMITQAEFADNGEYVCVAENVFARRESYAAKLDIYQDGGWTDWSHWSACNSKCGKGNITRTRSCTNPKPINGKQCEGKSNETADCTTVCPKSSLDGWSEWSPWSSCSQQCTQDRQRSCVVSPNVIDNDPRTFCKGTNTEQRNCSGDHCTLISLGTVYPPYKNEDHGTIKDKKNQDSNLALYFGLITIVGLFIIVVLVIVFFIQRRNRYGLICGNTPQHVNYLSHEAYHTEALAMSGKYREGPQYPPGCHYNMQQSYHGNPFGLSSGNLTNTTCANPGIHNHINLTNGGLIAPISACNAPIPSTHIANGSNQNGGNFFLMPAAQYGLFQGDLVPTSAGTNDPTAADSPKHYRVQAGGDKSAYCQGMKIGANGMPLINVPLYGNERISSLLDHYEDLPEDAPLALAQEYQMKTGLQNAQNNPNRMPLYAEVPINIEPHCIAKGKVGYAGGRLCIPDSKVSLLIPEGAIPRGSMQDVYIAVCRDERQIPNLTDKPKMTVLSPVIITGPPGIKFNKPVILSFEHSARATIDDWTLKVLAGANWCESIPVNEISQNGFGLNGPPSSNNNNSPNSPTTNSSLFCQIDTSTSFIMCDTLKGQYCLIGGQYNAATLVTKSIRCAAFTTIPSKNTIGRTNEISFRVYSIPNYRDSWEFVNEIERQIGGTLVANAVEFDFVSYNENLVIQINDLSSEWMAKSPQLEIPYEQLWNKVESHTPHIKMSLFRNHKDTKLESLNFKLTLGQRSFSHSKKSIAIKLSATHLMAVNNAMTLESMGEAYSDNESGGDSGGGGVSSGPPISTSIDNPTMLVFRLSPEIRQRLIENFDKAHGKNWYHLATVLKLDHFQAFFASKQSPTEHILDLWEARHRDRNSVSQLIEVLKSLAQYEVASMLERELPNLV